VAPSKVGENKAQQCSIALKPTKKTQADEKNLKPTKFDTDAGK
jgi:hypothetical protein